MKTLLEEMKTLLGALVRAWGVGAVALVLIFATVASTTHKSRSAPNRLTDGLGGYLLAIPVSSEKDSLLSVLRVVGDPNTMGRVLALNATVNDAHTIMNLRAYASDGLSRIVVTDIFANNVLVASCPTMAGRDVGECNYDWPVSSMLAGNNELRMEYERTRVGTAAPLRFQTFGRIGKP